MSDLSLRRRRLVDEANDELAHGVAHSRALPYEHCLKGSLSGASPGATPSYRLDCLGRPLLAADRSSSLEALCAVGFTSRRQAEEALCSLASDADAYLFRGDATCFDQSLPLGDVEKRRETRQGPNWNGTPFDVEPAAKGAVVYTERRCKLHEV